MRCFCTFFIAKIEQTRFHTNTKYGYVINMIINKAMLYIQITILLQNKQFYSSKTRILFSDRVTININKSRIIDCLSKAAELSISEINLLYNSNISIPYKFIVSHIKSHVNGLITCKVGDL